MSENPFVLWYAKKINSSDYEDTHAKLLAMRDKSPRLYEFLVEQYKTLKAAEPIESKANIVKKTYKHEMVERMKCDSSVTFMAAESNIVKKKYMTRMASSSNIVPYSNLKEEEEDE
jgi:hypothetical protein